MAVLHLPDNIKVHFAGAEVSAQYIAIQKCGVVYGLYTAFPFVEKIVYGKTSAPIIPLRWMSNPAKDIPTYLESSMRHIIQDSGLFTLMFGARRGKHLCKTMRGVKSNGEMSVSHLSGIFLENADARREFYKLIEINK